tara:strand:- start:2197 stop:3006 length:810 start_codon:yes stop_codon:yes gene_type:complete
MHKWQRMSVNEEGRLGLSDAWYYLSDSSIQVQFGDKIQQIDERAPEMIIHKTKDALGESTSLMCCVDCIHFSQSGMFRDMMETAFKGQCSVHGAHVDLFFHCEQLYSQDHLRPRWEAVKPDLGNVEDLFAAWLKREQPFVIFENGTILIEDPSTKSGDYQCRTLLPSLINVLPSIKVEEHHEFFVIEHFGFVYSIVSKKEWSDIKEMVCAEIAADLVFQDAEASKEQWIQIPNNHPQKEIALLSWNRLVRDSRGAGIASFHQAGRDDKS